MPGRKLVKVIICLLVLGMGIWYGPLLINLLKPSYIESIAPNSNNSRAATPSSQASEFSFTDLGISAPLQAIASSDPTDYRNWSSLRHALEQGVGLSFPTEKYEDSAVVYVIGHSSDIKPLNPYAYVFAGLGQAKIGQEFKVSYNATGYTYKVIDKKILDPANVDAFREIQPKSSDDRLAVLVTCWPVLTTKERLVIVGELTDTQPLE